MAVKSFITLAIGGSMGPRFVLGLLLNSKIGNNKIANNSTSTKAREKLSSDLES
jgi:hypothetical protein